MLTSSDETIATPHCRLQLRTTLSDSGVTSMLPAVIVVRATVRICDDHWPCDTIWTNRVQFLH